MTCLLRIPNHAGVARIANPIARLARNNHAKLSKYRPAAGNALKEKSQNVASEVSLMSCLAHAFGATFTVVQLPSPSKLFR